MTRERNTAQREAEKYVNDPVHAAWIVLHGISKADAMDIFEAGYLRGNIDGLGRGLQALDVICGDTRTPV